MQVPEEIPTPAPAGSALPNLVAGTDGSVLLSWVEVGADGESRLSFSRLIGGEWREPVEVARGDDWFVNWADFPSMIELADGTLAAHYLQRRAGAERAYHYDVRIVQSGDDGATWSSPVTPHRSSAPAEYGFVSLFPDPSGELGAVWLDGRMYDPAHGATDEMTLRYTTIGRDGTLGSEVVIDDRICDCCQTSVAHSAEGPLVVYRDRTHGEVRDISISRLTAGRWSPGVPVHDDGWVIPACPVNGPSASADGERVAVAWFTAAGDEPIVRFALSTDGGVTFAPPLRVDDGAPIGRVSIAFTGDGRAIVVWMERAGGDEAAIRYRILGSDRTLSAPVTLATTSATRASGFPRIVVAGNQAVFAWTETGSAPIVRTAVLRLEG